MAWVSRLVLAAVVVAAAVLAALGWVSLRQWERSAELVYREQARDLALAPHEPVGGHGAREDHDEKDAEGEAEEHHLPADRAVW